MKFICLQDKDRAIAPEAMQEIRLSLFSDQRCLDTETVRDYIAESMICAGVESHHVSVCHVSFVLVIREFIQIYIWIKNTIISFPNSIPQ